MESILSLNQEWTFSTHAKKEVKTQVGVNMEVGLCVSFIW